MGWFDDTTTWIGDKLTFTSEKDVKKNNEYIASAYANASLSVGSSDDELTGNPINNSVQITYDGTNSYTNFNESLSLMNDIRSYNEKQNFFNQMSSEEQQIYLKRVEDLYKVYYGSKLSGEDAVANFKLNGDPNARYGRNDSIVRASMEAASEYGIKNEKFLLPYIEEADELAKARKEATISQPFSEQELEVISNWENKWGDVLENGSQDNTSGVVTVSDEPEFHASTEKLWDTYYNINGVGGNTYSSESGALNSIKSSLLSGEYKTTPSSSGDCRVSLNIIPLSNMNNIFLTTSEFNERMSYVLGNQSGFLYNLYKNTAGLVFPYTPSIRMNSSVDYESIDINHSNLAVQSYKTTPPPGLSLTAEFTADTEENAIYMVGAIWFFRALSKCDFGEKSQNPGMPPPILYLNGWGNLINNIPVVITSFDVNLEKDKHYVKVNVGTEQWVPTKLTMSIGLKIQPNIDLYKKQFSLEDYKNGILGGTYDLFLEKHIDEINNLDLSNSINFNNDFLKYKTNFYVEKSTNLKISSSGYVQHEAKDKDIYSSKTDVEATSVYKDKRGSGAGWTW